MDSSMLKSRMLVLQNDDGQGNDRESFVYQASRSRRQHIWLEWLESFTTASSQSAPRRVQGLLFSSHNQHIRAT